MTRRNASPRLQVTAGLIFRNGLLLISRRRLGGPLGGLWEFPGGKQEPGETLEACLEREIREELDVEVAVEGLYTRVDHDYEAFSITLHVYLCRFVGGEPKPLGVAEFRWVSPADLFALPFPPADREVLSLLRTKSPRLSP